MYCYFMINFCFKILHRNFQIRIRLVPPTQMLTSFAGLLLGLTIVVYGAKSQTTDSQTENKLKVVLFNWFILFGLHCNELN